MRTYEIVNHGNIGEPDDNNLQYNPNGSLKEKIAILEQGARHRSLKHPELFHVMDNILYYRIEIWNGHFNAFNIWTPMAKVSVPAGKGYSLLFYRASDFQEYFAQVAAQIDAMFVKYEAKEIDEDNKDLFLIPDKDSPLQINLNFSNESRIKNWLKYDHGIWTIDREYYK